MSSHATIRHGRVRETIVEWIREFNPDIIGRSVTTSEHRMAGRIVDLACTLKPTVKIVVGGYDLSLAAEAYEEMDVGYVVRGAKLCALIYKRFLQLGLLRDAARLEKSLHIFAHDRRALEHRFASQRVSFLIPAARYPCELYLIKLLR